MWTKNNINLNMMDTYDLVCYEDSSEREWSMIMVSIGDSALVIATAVIERV